MMGGDCLFAECGCVRMYQLVKDQAMGCWWATVGICMR